MKTFFISITLIIIISSINAQSYKPITKEGARWIVMLKSSQPSFPEKLFEYHMTGDTTIDDIDYKKVYHRDLVLTYDLPPYQPDVPYELKGFVRDDTIEKKVYAIDFNPDMFSSCPEDKEYLMYDFSYQIGDTITFCTYFDEFDDTLSIIEQGEYFGVNSKRFQIENSFSYYEGIGSDFGLFETMFIGVKKNFRGVNFALLYYCPNGNCDLVVGSEEFQLVVDVVTVFPNPFSTSTTIEYQLDQPSDITIHIYNHLGEMVDLIQQKQSQGKLQVVWNAEDLPPGMYFYTLKAGDQVATGKMVLMK